MLMDGPMSSRAGERAASHPEEFFDQQGSDIISFQRVTIGSLPEDILLDIFGFYQEMIKPNLEWQKLVQVCRSWRCVVFASPHRLGLKFQCLATTPVREMLEIWPPMEIIICDSQPTRLSGDNIIAALEHPDRVYHIELYNITSFLLERLATVMQEPCPVLTLLHLTCESQVVTPPMLPDTFLGGSAPHIWSLLLSGIPFPAIPKLLLSARDLVEIMLVKVPHTGYFSPEAVVTCLSALTKLDLLILEFQSPSSRPDRGSQPPLLLTRVDLPALTRLRIQGVSEYWEDFLVRINTPVITATTITFFNRVIFDIPQLFKFVSRTVALGSVKGARLFFNEHFARLSLHRSDSPQRGDPSEFPNVGVRCDAFDWKISFLVQICNQLFPLISSVGRLDIECEGMDPLDWQDDLDHTQWLEIFRPFIAVQSLYIRGLDGLIAPALQELTGVRVMEVLPALRSLFITDPDPSGSVGRAIELFITARQLCNQPVTVHR